MKEYIAYQSHHCAMPGQRIEYLDAIRGLAMLFVVMAHIQFFSIGRDFPGLLQLTSLLMIPLFFFVSGFFAYRASAYWTKSNILKTAANKFMSLVVPALIFMIAYVLFDNKISIAEALYQPFKYGYWFTFTLFLFFLLYIPLARLARNGNKLFDLLIVFEMTAAVIAGIKFHYHEDSCKWIGLLGLRHLPSYMFFVLGILWRRHSGAVQRIISNNAAISVICICFFIGGIACYNGYGIVPATGLFSTAYLKALSFLGIAMTMILFRRYKCLSGENPCGRFLKLCGTWSLGIYFIHYFLLPRNLSFIADAFNAYPNGLLEFTLVLMLGAFVSGASIIFGKILSASPFLSSFLFGKRQANNINAIQK